MVDQTKKRRQFATPAERMLFENRQVANAGQRPPLQGIADFITRPRSGQQPHLSHLPLQRAREATEASATEAARIRSLPGIQGPGAGLAAGAGQLRNSVAPQPAVRTTLENGVPTFTGTRRGITASDVETPFSGGGTLSVSGVTPDEQAERNALVTQIDAAAERIRQGNLERLAQSGDRNALALLATRAQTAQAQAPIAAAQARGVADLQRLAFQQAESRQKRADALGKEFRQREDNTVKDFAEITQQPIARVRDQVSAIKGLIDKRLGGAGKSTTDFALRVLQEFSRLRSSQGLPLVPDFADPTLLTDDELFNQAVDRASRAL